GDLSLSADGHMLATVLRQSHFDLFAAPASDLSKGEAQQLTTGASVGNFTWTPEGQMILQEDALSLFSPDKGSKTPLTSPKQDGVAFWPSACSNGRYVMFALMGHGGARTEPVWRMDAG